MHKEEDIGREEMRVMEKKKKKGQKVRGGEKSIRKKSMSSHRSM